MANDTRSSAADADPPVRTANDGKVILSGVPDVPAEISQRLQPYHHTRAAAFADWTADGSAIHILTRFGDVPQLHRVDMPGGARHQLTFIDEPVGSAIRRPEHVEVLYRMDAGGGEFFQLFLYDPTTGRHQRLTDGRSRNTGPVFSRDGRQIAFTSTRRDGCSNDVWLMSVHDPESARPLLPASDGALWNAADWDPEAARLLVQRYVSITESEIHLLDLATGDRERIAGDPAQAGSHVPIAFDRNAAGIFMTTDCLGEYKQLARLDLDSRRIELVTDDIEWDIEHVAFDRARSRAAFVANEGGVSRLYLLDPEHRRHRCVQSIPDGVVEGLGFSPDGRRLALTWNSATGPSDVYTLDLGSDPLDHGGLARWTFSEVGGLNADDFIAPELIEFPSFDGRMIPAFLYLPRRESPGDRTSSSGGSPYPVVIHIHGGPESQVRPVFSSLYQSWINEYGIAVLTPNVRGSSGYGKTYLRLDNGMLREDAVRDIGGLLDWIGTQPDLDQNRVLVYGGSYGGYMVLASLVHFGSRLRGGVDIVGISDFVTFLEHTERYRRDLRRAEYGDERDPDMRAFFERISPLRNAERITAPLFVIQGQNDPRVPVTESEQIVTRVRASGRPVWYMNALNEGHGYARKENQDLMRDLVVLFFLQHLL
jgi:dipeptidyl aminopeptidase/acylaminoacyl peptidase